MTNDEKAKAYDEALKRAKQKIDAGFLTEDDLSYIFPELRESEDERIRKEAISIVQSYMNICDEEGDPCLSGYKVLAWLEEQKYDRMKPIYDARESFESALEKAWNDYHNGYENVDKLEDDYVECAHAKGFREGYLFGIEKQKEQKLVATINGEPIPTENQSVDIPLAEWSEEDELMRTAIIQTLERFGGRGTTGMQIDWLKSLRPIVNANSEKVNVNWSEEDEKMIERLITRLNWITYNTRTDGTSPNITFFDEIAWLKSLRPSWKPSEEQMNALQCAINACESEWAYQDDELRSLLNDLKKL